MLTLHKLKHKRETCREAPFPPIFQHLSNPNISMVNSSDMRDYYLLRAALLFFQLYHLEDGKWTRQNVAKLTNRELWWVQLNHTHLKSCASRSMGIPRLTIKIRNSLTGKEPTTCNTSVTATSSWPGPVIMGGDFNHELSSLPIWKSLEEYGWKESRLFASCDPSLLPPTFCKRNSQGSVLASSSKDFILLCPKICRLKPHMSIWESSGLPDHNPIVLTLDVPVKSGATRQWKLPRSLSSDQISVLQTSVNQPVPRSV